MEIISTFENNLNNIKTSSEKISFIKDLTIDSYAFSYLNNSFTIINSINNILFIIYTNGYKSIISYNLIKNQIMSVIKNAHDETITSFRSFLDIVNKRDLILSISDLDNNIKLWNIKDWNCLLDLKNVNSNGFLCSACFLKHDNQIYILTSNNDSHDFYYDNSESIKVYDFNGNKQKELNNSNYATYFLDTFYDHKLSNNYIITGNDGYVKSYDYNSNEQYHKYCDNDNSCHLSIVIYFNENIINLIESSYDGNIRIWNFHSGILLYKIETSSKPLNGICLWNNNFLFVGCNDNNIRLIDIDNKKVINTIKGHNSWVLSLIKINYLKYGECLISQGYGNDSIKLWIFKI